MNMDQKNIQAGTLQQKMEQTQTLSPQQVMVARLTEMSVEALKGRIENECQENPWLEKAEDMPAQNPDAEPYDDAGGQSVDEDSGYRAEDDYSSEDDIPDYLIRQTGGTTRAENIEWADAQTFYDRLKEQAGEYDLTDRQQRIMDYLIGSLEDSGMLTKPVQQLADELEIYQGIAATPEEVEEVLHVIWQFDPPGIGARSMQECLLIQIARREPGEMRRLMDTVIRHFYDEFIKKHWGVIQQQMQLSTAQVGMLQHELLRLNPRPGLALSETMVHGTNHITPDFVVDTDTEGNITMTLNEGDLPQVVVSQEAVDKVAAYEASRETLSRSAKEDLQFTREYVVRGQLFVKALQQRRDSMVRTMQAIIRLQHDYFLDGDEMSLHPMRLEDVSQQTGLDISTVSRVCTSKYVQTAYGTIPLKGFFSSSVKKDGSEVSVKKVKAVIQDILDNEDKRRPYSDEQLSAMLQGKGADVARRTVAKYRESIGYPVARLRKEHL